LKTGDSHFKTQFPEKKSLHLQSLQQNVSNIDYFSEQKNTNVFVRQASFNEFYLRDSFYKI